MQWVRSAGSGRWNRMAIGILVALALAPSAFGQAAKKKAAAPAAPAPTTTMERIRSTGTLKLGYRTDARPFSFKDASGGPTGYSVELCQGLPDAVKSELNLPSLKVEWVPVQVDERLSALQEHQVDVLCGAMSVTLDRRKQVDFSVPMFPGGVGVVVRKDASKQLRNILSGQAQNYTPTWRAVALNIVREQVFATITGTTAEQWVKQRGQELGVHAAVAPVASYEEGIKAVLDRKVNAFFGERAIVLDAVKSNPSGGDLTVIDRQFTYEPLALPMARGDDDFRLLVDKTVSQFYRSEVFPKTYTKWFGQPDSTAKNFFRWNALPD
jgi:ABC-type amino acid transport substrate-binding protein